MVLYPSPIFGPVRSRRLGLSLGVNLLTDDGKTCTFDCAYCECGLGCDNKPAKRVPKIDVVASALEAKLREMAAEGQAPDVITFAGNGEPTLNACFPEAIDVALSLRNELAPKAKISVLSNGARLHLPKVFEAFMKVDNPIVKLDTVDPTYIHYIDRPTESYRVEAIVELMRRMEGRAIVQTMFLSGSLPRLESVDNTGEEYVGPWLKALKVIQPKCVMVYTIDRETPYPTLRKVAPGRLDAIAERVRALGLACNVAY